MEYIPLENLLEPLAPIADHWRNLAAALEVPQDVITAINTKYTGSATDCLRDLLDWWSKKQEGVQNAWKVLTEALLKHGHENISKNLTEKYLSSTDEENQAYSTVSSEPPMSPSRGHKEHQSESVHKSEPSEETTDLEFRELGGAAVGQLQSQHTGTATDRFRGVLAIVCRNLGQPETNSLKFMCRSVIPYATLSRMDGSLEVLVKLMDAGKLSPTQLDLMTEIFRILGWEVHLKTMQDAGFSIPVEVKCDEIGDREFIFTKYLMKIAQELTDEEVQQLGFTIVSHWRGMGDQVEYSAIQLFIVLLQRRIITPAHVTRLHHELHELKRQDLCLLLEEYITTTKQDMPQAPNFVLEPSAEVYQPQTPERDPGHDPEQLLSDIQEDEAKTEEVEAKVRQLVEKIKKPTEAIEEKYSELQAYKENLSALETELEVLGKRRKEVIAKIPKPHVKPRTYDIGKERNHGLALIINNFVFTEDTDDISQWVPEHALLGRNIDEHNLIEIFSMLGYKVVVQQNCKAESIFDLFRDIQTQDHSKYDSFICCIMSQGSGRHILGSDNKLVAIEQLMNLLRKESCPSLARKPKMFFIHAYSMDAEPDVASENPDSSLIPESMDFICMYTNPPMSDARRDAKFGSMFCRALCDTFYVNAQQYDLLTMLTMVADRLSKAVEPDQKYYPMIISQLRKQVRFHLIRQTSQKQSSVTD